MRLEQTDIAPGRYQWSVSTYDKHGKFMRGLETIDPPEIFAIEDPEPVEANRKKVLIDLTHSGGHISGWGYYNHSQYMTKELLENAGFKVEVNKLNLLTMDRLESIDLLICHYYWTGWSGFQSYTKSELSAVRRFIERGGSLLIVGCDKKSDGGRMYKAGNELAREFGLLFNLDKITEESGEAVIPSEQKAISFSKPIPVQLPLSVQGEEGVTFLRFNGQSIVRAKNFGKGRVVIAGVGMSFLDSYLGDFGSREPLHLILFYDLIRYLTDIDWKNRCKPEFVKRILSRCQFQDKYMQ